MKSTTLTLTGIGDTAMTHGRWDGQHMHDAGDGFIGWIGHGSWIRYADVDVRGGIVGAAIVYSSGWQPEPRTVEVWVAPLGSPRPDSGELAALIHMDASTGSYEAASSVTATAPSVSPTPGGRHDIYVLFRGHEFNYGGLHLTLRDPVISPPRPARRGVPPVEPRPHTAKTQTPQSRTPEIPLTLVQGGQVYPEIAWPANPRAHVRWSSSKKSVATVTPKGKITAHTPGTARITVTADGSLATFKVKVVPRGAGS
ncbi:MAG: Ig-like domain-containing protein [Bifidobacteriaceae bacterium]|nr:Ig-like domain-containing protein [Bifidobacteriaceae bacterium]